MELFTRKKKRLWPFVAISCFVLLTALLWCLFYFSTGRNLQLIDMRKYAHVERAEESGYIVTTDIRQMLKDLHLPNPYLSENAGMDVEAYPDVMALSTLSFVVTEQEDGYLVQTASNEGEQVLEQLRRYGYGLTNTEWTWSADDIVAAYIESQEYPRQLSMQAYALVSGTGDGEYLLTVDTDKLLNDSGWVLPDDPAAREADNGYRAVMSLGFLPTRVDAGYQIDTTSTMQNVVQLLEEKGIQLTQTSWIWSVDEVQSAFEAQGSVVVTPEPTIMPDPGAQSPEPDEQEPDVTPPPETDAAPDDAEATETAPSAPEINTDKDGCLTSLHGYDQMELRRAIAAAKDKQYGAAFRSSTVLTNYFFVAASETAEYANCFRILYTIKTSKGTEYMTADVYNIHADDSITAANVAVQTYTSKTKAADLGAFEANDYTKYVLAGGSMVYAEDGGKSPFDDKGLVFDDSLERSLTTAELWTLPTTKDLTLLQVLGYARNEIFAMFGHRYKSGKYYEQYRKQDWYKPTGSYDYNDIDAKYPKGAANISLIKELERLIKEG